MRWCTECTHSVCHIDWLAQYYVMSLTRRLHMRLTRPSPLCPLCESRRSHCILFSLPPSLTFSLSLSLALSHSLFISRRVSLTLRHVSPPPMERVSTLHTTSATGERERNRGTDGSHRAEQRERINTRADTYRGRINHRKIMHVTSTERAGNGERERVPPGCTSIRVFLSLHTGWAGIRSTTEQWVILRQKIRKKFGITFFHLGLGFRENRL